MSASKKKGRNVQKGKQKKKEADPGPETKVKFNRRALRARSLSRRERQVSNYRDEGFTAKETAHYLNISPRTVEVYRRRCREKKRARFLRQQRRRKPSP